MTGRTSAEVLRAAELWRHGWPIKHACLEVGIARTTLYAHLKKIGDLPPNLPFGEPRYRKLAK